MPLTTSEKLNIGIAAISALAAIASAVAAYKLYALDDVQREFLRKQNAANAMSTWQSNVSQKAASGFRCKEYLDTLETRVFKLAYEKKAYDVVGESPLTTLKLCLDRENKKSVPELNATLESKTDRYAKPVHIDEDVSSFITTSTLDYLNFTEAVFLEWKYDVADRCMIILQLGLGSSGGLRKIVKQPPLPDDYTALTAFFEAYPTDAKLKEAIAACEEKHRSEQAKAKHP